MTKASGCGVEPYRNRSGNQEAFVYQQEAVEAIVQGAARDGRGQVIAACAPEDPA